MEVLLIDAATFRYTALLSPRSPLAQSWHIPTILAFATPVGPDTSMHLLQTGFEIVAFAVSCILISQNGRPKPIQVQPTFAEITAVSKTALTRSDADVYDNGNAKD
ncbi:hypothetical protein AYI69_g6436 [Smittium culicis]|uniref:Uncharacterized protein n=1 Tax=Smittium culicis TaxID=133412 RepID=A0A1R1XZ97_9FUNG|nr:hypothetical protein AYI69_g6436 [Smittium culicis]